MKYLADLLRHTNRQRIIMIGFLWIVIRADFIYIEDNLNKMREGGRETKDKRIKQ